MAIEIVDSPIQNVNFPQQTVSLPEVIHSTDLHLTSSRPLIRVPHHRSSSRLPPGRMPRNGLRRFSQGGTPYTLRSWCTIILELIKYGHFERSSLEKACCLFENIVFYLLLDDYNTLSN